VTSPIPELERAGWRWTPDGVVVTVGTSVGRQDVLVPVATLDLIFGREFRAVGCASYSVGNCYSVGGLFSKAKKSLKKLREDVKRRVAKTGAVGRWAVRTGDRVTRVAAKVAKVTDKVVRHPAFRAALGAAAAATGGILAPAAAAVETYAQVANRVEQGAQAAKAIDKGISNAKNVRSLKDAERLMSDVVGPAQRAAAMGDPRAKQFVAGVNAARKLGPKKLKSFDRVVATKGRALMKQLPKKLPQFGRPPAKPPRARGPRPALPKFVRPPAKRRKAIRPTWPRGIGPRARPRTRMIPPGFW
jgi:hypothetical protein